MPRSRKKQGIGGPARSLPKLASAWRRHQREKANAIYLANLAAERAEREAKKEAAMRIAGGY